MKVSMRARYGQQIVVVYYVFPNVCIAFENLSACSRFLFLVLTLLYLAFFFLSMNSHSDAALESSQSQPSLSSGHSKRNSVGSRLLNPTASSLAQRADKYLLESAIERRKNAGFKYTHQCINDARNFQFPLLPCN